MEKIVFHRVVFNPTFRCTLKCELCCVYAPYFPPPGPYYPFQDLTEQIARFFEIVDFADIFTIAGGEPLLHKSLADIVDFVNQYRTRIGRLEIITNGTLLPSERLIQSVKAANARFLVDDYGPELSIKAEEIEALLKERNVMHERRPNGDTEKGAHCDGWLDILHFSDEPISQHEAEKLFSKCMLGAEPTTKVRCNPVVDGRVYVCSPYEFCLRNGKIEDDPRYYIDLTDRTQSVESQKEKAIEFLNIKVLPSCSYCNGFLLDGKRYVPARQLKS